MSSQTDLRALVQAKISEMRSRARENKHLGGSWHMTDLNNRLADELEGLLTRTEADECKRCDGTGQRYNNAAEEVTECGACKARSEADEAATVGSDNTFAAWLATEMPAGTVIGNPAWWANRIARQYRVRSGITHPQDASAGWIDVAKETPPEDVPVWCLTKGDGIFIGGYVYIDEGWVWTNAYNSIYHTLKDGEWKWEANDLEYDDEYEVIAWQALPSPPKGDSP